MLTVTNVMLERLRLTYPSGLSVQEAIRAGVLIGGAQLILNEGLRMLALDELENLGVVIDRERAKPARHVVRGALPQSSLYIAARGNLTTALPPE